jgi:uncharacterized protein (TIGR00369 family)
MSAPDAVSRFAAVPYHAHLGMVADALDGQSVRLRIPFREANANPGGALHGGVYASAIDAAAALLARGPEPDHALDSRTLDLAVSYLAAAIGSDVVAEGRLLRRGKELAFVDVAVREVGGKDLARGLVTHRVAAPSPADQSMSDVPRSALTPGEVPDAARAIESGPFMAARRMKITLMHGGRAIVAMPSCDANADRHGAVHEGAVAALLDTAGAMASWSVTGVDLRYRASTPAIHLSFHAAVPPGEGVVAHARTLSRARESFLNAVTVYAADSGRAVASGSVTYRIVT